MRIKDYLRLGRDQLKRRLVVTGLCAMGIAIGSASIIVALSFGESISHYSEQSMNRWFKMDELNVYPGYIVSEDGEAEGRSVPVTASSLELIGTFPGVEAAAPFQQMDYLSFAVDETKQGNFELIATKLETLPAFGHELRQGAAADIIDTVVINYAATLDLYDERTLTLRSLQQQSGNAGADEPEPVSYPLYQKNIMLQKQVALANGTSKMMTYPLRVVGVLARPEGLPTYMLRNPKRAYISLETAEKIRSVFAGAGDPRYADQPGGFEGTLVKVADTGLIPQVETLIRKLNLNVQSNLYQQERMKEEMIIIRFLFGGVGLFILLVASLTIIVAMTMATHQRRRQIGIMKVLGANLAQIRNMFIIEAGLLGILGGLLGILFSHWVIWGINTVIIRFSGQGPEGEILFISYWVLPLGLFFAIMTGVLSGLYPAIKASRTDALTAIKRE